MPSARHTARWLCHVCRATHPCMRDDLSKERALGGWQCWEATTGGGDFVVRRLIIIIVIGRMEGGSHLRRLQCLDGASHEAYAAGGQHFEQGLRHQRDHVDVVVTVHVRRLLSDELSEAVELRQELVAHPVPVQLALALLLGLRLRATRRGPESLFAQELATIATQRTALRQIEMQTKRQAAPR